MSFFLEIDHVDKVFPLTGGGSYVALKNIELQIRQGEFVTLIGHSGCGKSTLLSIVAGLDKPSVGGVVLEGRQVTSPGPERMMVFQNYSLLPMRSRARRRWRRRASGFARVSISPTPATTRPRA